MAKRLASQVGLPERDTSIEPGLRITPLGAGNEVGRSCVLLEYKGKTVLLDCGIHPAYTGIASLPYFDSIEDPAKIDLLLVSQFVNPSPLQHMECP
jgi:cleavage and polyadenylation specificity factor subunit 3